MPLGPVTPLLVANIEMNVMKGNRIIPPMGKVADQTELGLPFHRKLKGLTLVFTLFLVFFIFMTVFLRFQIFNINDNH